MMRKIILAAFIGLASIGLVYGLSYAAITGSCASCHTMHYSQNGTQLSTWGSSGPYKYCLINGCLGCHTGTNDGNTPYVYTSGGGGIWLAGGNFYGDDTNDTTVHNVAGIALGDDGIITGSPRPPGFIASVALPLPATGTGPASWAGTQQVTCAGEYGCHGDRTVTSSELAAIKGAHHSNTDINNTDPSTIGGSYRFLYGIGGAEDSNWEYSVSSDDHNGYFGATAYSSTDTISYLCGECHGNFHAHSNLGDTAEVGSDSPWLRHPSDVLLSGGEYAAYDTYSTEAPVALATPSTSQQSTAGSAIVMCLSCHRAHGSNQPDLLRWDYGNMIAGNAGSYAGTGCFRCHSEKD